MKIDISKTITKYLTDDVLLAKLENILHLRFPLKDIKIDFINKEVTVSNPKWQLTKGADQVTT